MGGLQRIASDSEGQHEERYLGERIVEEEQWRAGAKETRLAAPVRRKLHNDGERVRQSVLRALVSRRNGSARQPGERGAVTARN